MADDVGNPRPVWIEAPLPPAPAPPRPRPAGWRTGFVVAGVLGVLLLVVLVWPSSPPPNAAGDLDRAHAAYSEGRYDEARAALAEARAGGASGRPVALLEDALAVAPELDRAESALKEKDFDGAAGLVKHALSLAPGDARALALAARIEAGRPAPPPVDAPPPAPPEDAAPPPDAGVADAAPPKEIRVAATPKRPPAARPPRKPRPRSAKAPAGTPEGFLSVNANVSGVVFVDGRSTGKRPPVWMHPVPVGRHRVEIRDGSGKVLAGTSANVREKQVSPVILREGSK